jgi:hypothetical protein
MARQVGALKIRGSIHGICFYKLHGEYYARTKSSLSGKRVKTSPAFQNTMRYAELLAKASVISSQVYRLIMQEKKGRKIYQQLTGAAMQLLKDGLNKEEVARELETFKYTI